MGTSVNLPGKRGQHLPLEGPPKNRRKLDYQPGETVDAELKLQKGGATDGAPLLRCRICHANHQWSECPKQYCMICRDTVGHRECDCPNKAFGYGKYCSHCREGPAREKCLENHPKKVRELLKVCFYCGMQGNHWEEECPAAHDEDEMKAPYDPSIDDEDWF